MTSVFQVFALVCKLHLRSPIAAYSCQTLLARISFSHSPAKKVLVSILIKRVVNCLHLLNALVL